MKEFQVLFTSSLFEDLCLLYSLSFLVNHEKLRQTQKVYFLSLGINPFLVLLGNMYANILIHLLYVFSVCFNDIIKSFLWKPWYLEEPLKLSKLLFNLEEITIH